MRKAKFLSDAYLEGEVVKTSDFSLAMTCQKFYLLMICVAGRMFSLLQLALPMANRFAACATTRMGHGHKVW